MKHIRLFEEFLEEKRGLWDNVWAKRKRGEKPAKPGDKDYPDEDAWDAAQESEVLESEETYSDYPKTASANAKKALEWRDKYGRDEVEAGTAVGWQRANQLAKGEAVSRDVVSRMAQFNRHRKDSKIDPKLKDTPWKDRGYVSWLIWGGDEGVDWAMAKMDQIKKEEVKENLSKAKMFEDFVNEFQIPSNKWIEMDLKKIDKEGMQEIWDMYTKTYLDAGMDLSADDWQEMQTKYKATALKDVDSDHTPDAFIIYKPTKWGNKIALLGTNGKKEAKSDIVKKLLQLVNTKGWFIEASLKMEEILSKSNAPVVKDEDMIRDVVGADKKPEFTEDGYYTRFLSKAGKRITKRIYGKI